MAAVCPRTTKKVNGGVDAMVNVIRRHVNVSSARSTSLKASAIVIVVSEMGVEHCSYGNTTITTTPAYDDDGLLNTRDLPIFECNELCGCDDSCQNKVRRGSLQSFTL